MNVQLFDLVCDYLDENIDEQAWQSALAEHGDELLQLLKEEQAVRSSIQNLPKQAMPAALRAQLQDIPQQHAAATPKPSLVFPIFNTVAALAACLAITFIAIYSANSTPNKDFDSGANEVTTLSEEQENSLDRADVADQAQREPAAAKAERKSQAAQDRPGNTMRALKEQELSMSDKATMDGGVHIEVLNDDAAVPAEPMKKGDAAAAPAMAPQASHLRGAVEKRRRAEAPLDAAMVLEADADEAPKLAQGARKKAAPDAVFGADALIERAEAAESKDTRSTAAKQEFAEAGNLGAATATTEKPIALQADKAAPTDNIADQEMHEALKEARSNLAKNKKVQDAIAQSKANEAAAIPQAKIIGEMIAANKGMLDNANDTQHDKKFDVSKAPPLQLQLSATAKATYLDVLIGMNGEIEAVWINRAIANMELIGLDKQEQIVWRSPIVVNRVNEDINLLRSKDLPPKSVRSIVLESLEQRSKPIAYSIK